MEAPGGMAGVDRKRDGIFITRHEGDRAGARLKTTLHNAPLWLASALTTAARWAGRPPTASTRAQQRYPACLGHRGQKAARRSVWSEFT